MNDKVALLQDLDLSGCRINYLLADTFQGLKQLRKLDLSNNMMMELDKGVLRTMPYLQSLTLGQYVFYYFLKIIVIIILHVPFLILVFIIYVDFFSVLAKIIDTYDFGE